MTSGAGAELADLQVTDVLAEARHGTGVEALRVPVPSHAQPRRVSWRGGAGQGHCGTLRRKFGSMDGTVFTP